MRKITNIFLAVLITLFSFPFGGLNVSAEGKTYDDIKDGEYEIGVSSSSSTVDNFLTDNAVLIVEGEKLKLTVSYGVEGYEINWTKLEGQDPIEEVEEDGVKHFTFEIDEIKSTYDKEMEYAVPGMPGLIGSGHEVDYDIILDQEQLKNLPVVEEEEQETTPEEPEDNEKPESPEEEETEKPVQPEEPENPEEDPKDEGTDNEEGKEESKNSFKDLGDGYYTVRASHLHDKEEKASAMARYLSDTVFLSVKNGKVELTVTIDDNNTVTKLQVDGEDSTEQVINEEKTYETFTLNELNETISAYAEYQAPFGDSIHYGTADFRIVLDESSIESASEQDKPGYGLVTDTDTSLDSLTDGYYTVKASHLHDKEEKASAMARYLSDTVFLSVKNGKVELTVTIEDNNTVTKLQVNGEDPTGQIVNEEETYETFKLNELNETISAYAEYQAPFGDSIHYGTADFRIVLDESSIESASEKDKPGYGSKPDTTQIIEPNGIETSVSAGERLIIGGDEKSQLVLPDSLPGNVTVAITSEKEKTNKTVKDDGGNEIELAGEVYDFIFTGLEKYKGKFGLSLGIDTSKYSSNTHDIAIYHYDEIGDYWEEIKNSNVNGEVVVATVDHFSTYGVFAKEKPEENTDDETNGEDPANKDEESLVPDKAYEINYTILHEDGNAPSVADGFFQKPGTVLEYDGKTYFQMTVESAEMVQALSNKYGDYVLVDEKDGTKTMQLRVPNDLSDMKLDMHIVVPAGAIPGFPGYNEKHGAILTFDKKSKKDISVEGLEVAASDDKDNENGPFDEDAETPEPTPNPTPEPKDPKKKPGKDEDDPEKSLTPDKAYEINYTILNENGKDVSVADGFFRKPGILLEYGGKTYLQMTVESADMVKALSNKYGDYILVSNNADGTVTIQLRVPNDLSDMKLNMHIVVPAGAIPGFPGYNEKHGAILTFDKDSKKEISVEGLEVVASGDKNNQNGPYDENATPGKPSLGDNDDGDKKKKDEKTGNPKTGDTSQIFFFATLLMASLAVLVLQIRRRLAA